MRLRLPSISPTVGLLIALSVVGLMVIVAVVRGDLTQPSAIYKATYDVVGDGADRASLTYSNQGGGTEQKEVNLPWSNSFSVEPGDFLYISAQNKSGSGSITVYISINSNTRKIATSEGGHVIASSNYRCCN